DGALQGAFGWGPLPALGTAIVRKAALDVVGGGRRDGGARVRIAGRRLDGDASLGGTLVGGAILALRAVVVGNAADHVAAHGRHARAGVRQTRGGRRDGAALRRALVQRPVLALRALGVGNAADDVAATDRPALRELHGEHVLSRSVADHDEGAARIESEQLVVRRARPAAEPDAARPAAVGRELSNQDTVDQHVEGRIGIELLALDVQLAVSEV